MNTESLPSASVSDASRPSTLLAAFRFVTGHSDKNAYKITTGLATIGIRGTILDILSQRGRTVVTLGSGAARVCTLSFQCIELLQPGDTAIITSSANGKVTIQKTNNPPWTFAEAVEEVVTG